MRCGHCKDDHQTVAQVRLCAARNGIRPADNQEAVRTRPATSRDRHHDERRSLIAEVRAVSATIEEGHYAVPGEDGKLRFYVVQKGKPGTQWAGRTFLKVQASDELHKIQGLKTELAIYRKIAANPQEAMLAYGREIGRCGHCNRTLTDANSRERGIGPVCARNLGWIDLAA